MTNSDAEKYKVRRALWLDCLGARDRNSIMQQIYRMVWNAAAFRVINEARRLAPSNKDGEIKLSGLVHTLIDRGFADSQMLAIRRLTDHYPITDHKRSVFSLISLLNDIQNHLSLMTRENVFFAEGLTYDVEAVRRRETEYLSQRGGVTSLPADAVSALPEMRHAKLDFLVGVSPVSRLPSDTVRPVIIDRLKAKITGSGEKIGTYVNKFVAHAASPDSRKREDAKEISITLDEIWHAHEIICKVANFVSVDLLNGPSRHILPVPQFDQFAYIDKPLLGKNDISKLEEVWSKYEKETQDWMRWGIDDLQAEIESGSQEECVANRP